MIGIDYDLSGIEDWDRSCPTWDISTRRGFLKDCDDEDLSRIAHLFRIKFRGHDYVVKHEDTAWCKTTRHLEFYGSKWGAISETGYRSHFFGVSEGFNPTAQEIKDFCLKVAEEVASSKKQKKTKPKPVPVGQLELF